MMDSVNGMSFPEHQTLKLEFNRRRRRVFSATTITDQVCPKSQHSHQQSNLPSYASDSLPQNARSRSHCANASMNKLPSGACDAYLLLHFERRRPSTGHPRHWHAIRICESWVCRRLSDWRVVGEGFSDSLPPRANQDRAEQPEWTTAEIAAQHRQNRIVAHPVIANPRMPH